MHLARSVTEALSQLFKKGGIRGLRAETLNVIVQLRKLKISVNWKLFSAGLKEDDSYTDKYKATQYLFWQV